MVSKAANRNNMIFTIARFVLYWFYFYTYFSLFYLCFKFFNLHIYAIKFCFLGKRNTERKYMQWSDESKVAFELAFSKHLIQDRGYPSKYSSIQC